MDSSTRFLRLGGALCVLLGVTAIGHAEAPPAADKVPPPPMAAPGTAPAQEPASGVWQEHKYQFQYMGFTSTFSCDGLADKLKLLLNYIGVRGDVKVWPGPCAASYGRPDKFARADLTFATLVPASTPGATGTPGIGAWKSVAISANEPRDLKIGDCEVVEQFRDVVLKKMFAVRNIVDNTRCVPYQESGTLIDLRFEVFAPLPGAQAVLPAVAGAAPAAPTPFAYPTNQQNAEQVARDRTECSGVAAAQSGFDPAHLQSAADGAQTAYNQALSNCLALRGYSVR